MIELIELIQELDADRFMEVVQESILEIQSRGLVVDVQYSISNHKHTAFITGRTKNNV